MRLTTRLLATASNAGAPSGMRASPAALLPPLPLYRRLLRGHRKHLSPEMRILGDQYVKKEFRDHKDVDNPIHIIGFLTEWQMYAQHIEGDTWKGDKLDTAKLDKMSDQQLGQMYELMQAIQEKDRSGEGGEKA